MNWQLVVSVVLLWLFWGGLVSQVVLAEDGGETMHVTKNTIDTNIDINDDKIEKVGEEDEDEDKSVNVDDIASQLNDKNVLTNCITNNTTTTTDAPISVNKVARVDLSMLSDRVVSGFDTTINAHPYQVSILRFNQHICGGCIISSRWILTAAHCNPNNITIITVRAGSTFRTSGGTLYNIVQFTSHGKYQSKDKDYDVAAVQTATSITMSVTVNTIPLPAATEDAKAGSLAVVTGWGFTGEAGPISEILQMAYIYVLSPSMCTGPYDTIFVSGSMICAGADGKDACQGDSGGPLVVNGKLAGTVSWGYGCARAGYPGVYCRITAYRSWIKTITGI